MSFQSCSTAARLLSSGWTFFAHASPGTAAMHPLVLVVDGVAVGLGDFDPRGKRLEVLRVDAAQSVGILGLDEDAHRQMVHHILHTRLFPLAGLGEVAQLHVARGRAS